MFVKINPLACSSRSRRFLQTHLPCPTLVLPSFAFLFHLSASMVARGNASTQNREGRMSLSEVERDD